MILIKLVVSIYFVLLFLCVRCADFDVGNSIDLLAQFGIVANILPIGSEDPAGFVDTSFSNNVFDKNAISKNREVFKVDEGKGTWKIHLCRNAESLLNTFFDNYNVELANRTSKLFASTWRLKQLEILFGIPQFYLMNQFAFLLIRQEKCSTKVILKNLPENETSLNSTFQQMVESINPPETITIYPTFLNFGTHFVKSFSVGDVIFQVLVYPKETLHCFVVNEKDNEVTGMYLDCVLNRIVRHGKIKTLSNTFQMEQLFNEIYNANSTSSHHKHLLDLKLQKVNISDDVCKLSNMAITGFSLSGIYNVIFNSTKSLFVKEMILNQMEIRDFYL
ncbi:torso-like protein [Planococcus citri]|uniref:torso-like protein n=1 Tax=Planococcus citri TaxID=170843 RepID=UPI0031F7F478